MENFMDPALATTRSCSPLNLLVLHPQIGPRTIHVLPLKDVLSSLQLVSTAVRDLVQDVLVEAYVQSSIQRLDHLWRLHERRPHYWIEENYVDPRANPTLEEVVLALLTPDEKAISQLPTSWKPQDWTPTVFAAKLTDYLVDNVFNSDMKSIGQLSSQLTVKSWFRFLQPERRRSLQLPEEVFGGIPGGVVGLLALDGFLQGPDCPAALSVEELVLHPDTVLMEKDHRQQYQKGTDPSSPAALRAVQDVLSAPSVSSHLRRLEVSIMTESVAPVMELVANLGGALEELKLVVTVLLGEKDVSFLDVVLVPLGEAMARRSAICNISTLQVECPNGRAVTRPMSTTKNPMPHGFNPQYDPVKFHRFLRNLNTSGKITGLALPSGTAPKSESSVFDISLKECIPNLRKFKHFLSRSLDDTRARATLDHLLQLFGEQLEFFDLSSNFTEKDWVLGLLLKNLNSKCEVDFTQVSYFAPFEMQLTLCKTCELTEVVLQVERQDQVVAALAHCPNILGLSLLLKEVEPGSFQDDLGLHIVALCPKLQGLGIYDFKFMEDWIGTTNRGLSHIRDLTDGFLVNLGTGLPNLEHVDLSYLGNVSHQALLYMCRTKWHNVQLVLSSTSHLGSPKPLRSSWSGWTESEGFPKDVVDCIPALDHCPRLQSVEFDASECLELYTKLLQTKGRHLGNAKDMAQ